LEERLFPNDQMLFLSAHSQTLTPGEKNAGDFCLHDILNKTAKKKEGVGHPTPSYA